MLLWLLFAACVGCALMLVFGFNCLLLCCLGFCCVDLITLGLGFTCLFVGLVVCWFAVCL